MLKCKIDGCIGLGRLRGDSRYLVKGLCSKHYAQMQRNGSIYITSRDNRKAIIEGDIAKIPLGVGAKNGYTIVDKNFAFLDKHKRNKDMNGYAVDGGKINRLHHLIIGKPPSGLVTDHINRNKLDNRISNLRHCTYKENNNNVGTKKSNTSGIVGVSRSTSRNKWIAQKYINGKQINLGGYDSKEKALQVYLYYNIKKNDIR